MHHLSIDLETFSSVPLAKAGAQKYIASPDFEILLFAYSVDGAPVEVIDLARGEHLPPWLVEAITSPEYIKHAYTILAILKGVFAMTSTRGAAFVKKHTLDVAGNMEASTLNSATAKACGDRKKKFAMIFLHSVVSTNLENLNLLSALKYTDKDGVTRDLTLYTWNGKLVVVDDGMPAVDGYFPAESTTPGALLVKASGASGSGQINKADVTPYLGEGNPAADSYVVFGTQYTSYVLGEGMIGYEDIGAKVPYEMDRDPAKSGGQDTLYTRQRKVFAPFGISYEKTSQASLSPTDDELANGANWDLVHSGESSESQRSYIDDKAIVIARILSRG